MSKQIAFVAVLSIMVLTLVLTLIADLFNLPSKSDLLDLLKVIFSWQVVAGSVASAAGSLFREEIKGVLNRIAAS